MRLRPPATLLLPMLLGACVPAESPPRQQVARPAAAVPALAVPAQAGDEAAPADTDFPALQIATLDGTRYDLAAHRGHWVVVNFWATWCKPCVKEMPELSALDAAHEHIDVLGLAYDDTAPQEIRAFLQKHPVAYPVAIVDTYDPPGSFAIPRGLPTTYLISPEGRLIRKFLGPVDAREIEGAIAAAGGPGAD